MEKLFVDGSCNKHTNNCGWGSLVGETKLKILEQETTNKINNLYTDIDFIF